MTNSVSRIDIKALTGNQRIAFKNAKFATDWRVGELENGLSDYEEDSAEYKACEAELKNRDVLIEGIVRETLNCTYGVGFCSPRPIKEVRFAGTEFITSVVTQLVTDMGY